VRHAVVGYRVPGSRVHPLLPPENGSRRAATEADRPRRGKGRDRHHRASHRHLDREVGLHPRLRRRRDLHPRPHLRQEEAARHAASAQEVAPVRTAVLLSVLTKLFFAGMIIC